MDKQIIRQKADDVRTTYLPNSGIPVDSQYIAEISLRLDIDPLKGLFAEFEIDAWLKHDLSGMIVDHDRYMDERFNNRLRFSFAHELGHYFLHRTLLKNLNFTCFPEWKEFILTLPEKEYKSFEWQANEFAGRLVVPLPALKIHFNAVCKKIREENSLLAILAKDPDLVLSSVSPTLCRPFGISDEVIETRVQREGLWPPISHFPEIFKK
jgi:hypothetical protein